VPDAHPVESYAYDEYEHGGMSIEYIDNHGKEMLAGVQAVIMKCKGYGNKRDQYYCCKVQVTADSVYGVL